MTSVSNPSFGRSHALAGVLVTLGVVLAGSTVWIASANPHLPHPALNATVSFATVAGLFEAGVYAWRRDPDNRFGRLLMLGGVGCFLAALSTSGDSLAYSVGRVSFWIVQPILILLLLAYPSGVLPGRREKALVAVAAICVAVLYLPTALVVQEFPLLPAYCSTSCPANAFRLVSAEPALVSQLVVPAREIITVGIYLAVAGLTFARLRQSRLMFRSLAPVLTAVIVRSLALGAAVVARMLGASAEQLEPFAWAALISTPLAALGFLVGLLRWRVYSARALEQLELGSGDPTGPIEMQARVAKALDDPSLELYLRDDSSTTGWREHTGVEAVPPQPSEERCRVEVNDAGRPLAMIVCDPALSHQRSVVDAAAGWLAAVLVRKGLREALEASIRSVENSRRRLARAAAVERRRIERDIHDGAQQQLVTLRLKLALAAKQLEQHPERGPDVLAGLTPSVDATIDEVRSIAHGIYPALLAHAGLEEALRSIARTSPTPTAVHAEDLGRYELEIEAAVYFCCLEAIQNATKHAEANKIVVALGIDDGQLQLHVYDDGRGFCPDLVVDSVGLANMRDRVAAIGGSLTIASSPGEGTSVRASVPVNSR